MKSDFVAAYEYLGYWQKAMQVVEAIYRVTRAFPREEQYGLTSQMRRAAVSIPSNIAEGKARRTNKDYRQFLIKAYGSANELDCQLKIAVRLGFCDARAARSVTDDLYQVIKMLLSAVKSLAAKDA